jgi:hypothetical protein
MRIFFPQYRGCVHFRSALEVLKFRSALEVLKFRSALEVLKFRSALEVLKFRSALEVLKFLTLDFTYKVIYRNGFLIYDQRDATI